MSLVDRIAGAAEHAFDPAQFLPLVEKQARRLARRLPAHIELGDLVSAGVLGLMEAMRRFDPARSVAFQSYASFRIRGAMLDELRRRDLMARDARRESKHIQKAMTQLRLRLGRSPENFELAGALGMEVAALEERLGKMPHVSITSIDDGTGPEPAELGPGAYEHAVKNQLHGQLTVALRTISERSQKVLELYYVESFTLKQIGQVLEISESRVSQIMSKATLELRGILAEQRSSN